MKTPSATTARMEPGTPPTAIALLSLCAENSWTARPAKRLWRPTQYVTISAQLATMERGPQPMLTTALLARPFLALLPALP
jgi:hypothetical protein